MLVLFLSQRTHPSRERPGSRSAGRARAIGSVLGLLAAGLLSTPAGATPVTFTNQAAFTASLPGPATTLDFDGLSAGTLIPSGTTLDGITFDYDFGGVSMKVTDVFDTTSPPNFLGTDDADVFQDGDDFDLLFAPVQAIGLYFITADDLLDGDIGLSAAGVTASLVASDVQQVLGDGSSVYFLGIIDDMGSFTSASVDTVGGGFFLYNVDDIVTAVPEPGTCLLVSAGLAWLGMRRRSGRGPR